MAGTLSCVLLYARASGGLERLGKLESWDPGLLVCWWLLLTFCSSVDVSGIAAKEDKVADARQPPVHLMRSCAAVGNSHLYYVVLLYVAAVGYYVGTMWCTCMLLVAYQSTGHVTGCLVSDQACTKACAVVRQQLASLIWGVRKGAQGWRGSGWGGGGQGKAGTSRRGIGKGGEGGAKSWGGGAFVRWKERDTCRKTSRATKDLQHLSAKNHGRLKVNAEATPNVILKFR